MDREGEAAEAENPLNLSFYWLTVKKRRWIIIGTTIIISTLAIVLAARKPKIFQATATVIVDPQPPNYLGGQQVAVVSLGTGNPWDSSEYFNTEIKILHSRQLLRDVVTRDNDAMLHSARLASVIPQGEAEDKQIDRAIDFTLARVHAEYIRESRIFKIIVDDTDAAFARKLANEVSAVFVDENLTNKQKGTQQAREWIEKRLDDAGKDLNKSETDLFDFKKDSRELAGSISLEDKLNTVSKGIETFSSALDEAKKRLIELEAKRAAVTAVVQLDANGAPTFAYISAAPTVDTLRGMYLAERTKLMELTDKYGPKWPDVVMAQDSVKEALANLQDEVKIMLGSLDAEIHAVEAEEGQYQAQLADLSGQALALSQKEIQYKQLARDAKNAEDSYGQLLARLNDSQLQEHDVANNIRLLDDALLPDAPVSPNVKLSAIVGVTLGLMLGFVLGFAVELLDRSVKSQEDIENTVGLSFLGLVPSIDGSDGSDFHVLRHPKSTVAECCRVVRTNLLFCSPDKPLRTILVSSPNPAEGKTLTVLNLGVVMAQNNQRTLIVDTDMRRPRLHKVLKTSNENGFSRLILGETDIESAVKSTDVPNLFILPCGPLPPNPAELLQTEKCEAVVRMLAEKFDRVIFDSPPILAVTDAAVLSRITDAAVMVCRAGRTTRDSAIRAKRSLTRLRSNITGVVLNDVNLKSPHYSDYYTYYYSSKYHEMNSKTAAASPTKG